MSEPKCYCSGHTGASKLLFPSSEDASEYRRRNKQIGDKLIYRCPRGVGWHLATRPNRREQRDIQSSDRSTQ